jgi:hypothetical protein
MEQEKLKEALEIIEAEKKTRAESFLKVVEEASIKYNCELIPVVHIGGQKLEIKSLINGNVTIEVVPK